LFHILNDARRRRGSIDFDLNEAEVVIDDAGKVEAIIALERNVAHRLIEEFMLLANETVASYLEAHHVATLYRVHEEPDPLKVMKFEEFISGFGYSLGAPATALRPRHFQKLIERIHGKPEEKPIALLMLRTMQKARYAPDNLGHFGLAAASYTHFTSPIRRYPDLVVHRTLREARHAAITPELREELVEELPETARHTSEMERRADDAERELLQWKKVKFMADKVGDEFEGYVIGVASFGLFVELVEHFVEGLVHVSTMADDYYRFVESGHLLRGENTHKVYRLGDRVQVQVIRVSIEQRQIDLGLVEILDRVRQGDRASRSERSRHGKGSDGRGPRDENVEHVRRSRGRRAPTRPGRRERQRRRGGR
jgi:ribonuclease R